MAQITWDNTGEKLYELGIDHGVYYPQKNGIYSGGVAWNGLTSVSESPSGADEQKFYADNILYGSLRGAEDFGGTIECYTYPDEFAEANGQVEIAPGVRGNQQTRKPFGLSYRTLIGNDQDGQEHGYKLHLVYNATVSPSEQQFQTVNDSPEPGTMSFEFACNPVAFTGHKPLSHIEIDSTKVDKAKLATLEAALYGAETSEARLPLPDEIASMMKAAEG